MSEIEEIKRKLDIVDIINRYLPLKKRGRHHVACCPFHSEKTPSFVVSPEMQIFKCFGCGKTGDMFTFVQEFERIDFKEALEDLAKLAGVKLTRSEGLTREDLLRRRLFLLNDEAARVYHYFLTTHPLGQPARDYLRDRHITTDTIKLFRMGFSPRNSTLITSHLIKKGFTRDELIASGSFGMSQYHPGQFYDRFSDRLVFPLIDSRDKIIGFSGRILPTSTNPNLAKYINSPETVIYHKSHTLFGINLAKESIKNSNSVIVVEGEFDMISPYQAGIKNIVAIKGTAFTEEQLQLLRRFTDTLIMGLDSDFAGNNAARKSIQLADSMEFDIRVVNLSGDFKDPDEAVRRDPQIFINAVDNSIPVWDFLIQSAVKANDPTTIRGKKNILSLVLPFISAIQNQVIRSDYYQKLASAIGSTPESITLEGNKLITPSTNSPSTNQVVSPPTSLKVEKQEEYLLSLILTASKPVALSKKIIVDYQFTVPKLNKIITLLSARRRLVPKKFVTLLPAEIQPTFQSAYLYGQNLTLSPAERRQAIQKVLAQLVGDQLRQRLTQISPQIAKYESLGDETNLQKLEKEYNEILAKISRLHSTKS